MNAIRTILCAALAFTVAACAAGEPIGESAGQTEEALTTNPCAGILCILGTHCEARGHRAACVPDTPGRCATDADCRLFDDYCDGCACQALSTKSPDPVCTGTTVACFAQPCAGKTAVCSRGMCVVGD